jgi:hypothetical protein
VKAVAEARNIPLAEPDGIASDAGKVRLAELELRLTVPPPVPERVTVQAPEELGAMVPGVQEIPEILIGASGAVNETVVVFELPFNVAVTVTV